MPSYADSPLCLVLPDNGWRSEYRTYTICIGCCGADRQKPLLYEIVAKGSSGANDVVMLGPSENFEGDLVDLVGVTGLGIVIAIDSIIEECCQYMKKTPDQEPVATTVFTVPHADYHPIANKVHMTTGFQDIPSQNDTGNNDGVNVLKKPKKFKPRSTTSSIQPPMTPQEGISSVTFGYTDKSSLLLSSSTGHSASTSKTLVEELSTTNTDIPEQVPKKQARYQPKRKITNPTYKDTYVKS
ncbi:uncharacterized protein MELLADRAFT_103261 [Melampsora larici-populina 98AG31]|uniref:Uncharacterized protein n=1 Tax=Melampsora larici-populina (strain 98AG31 / pathotype 3-4-7) TaxID=747676 RepID=F4R9T9_MELLP|nr:uncharacterized protein MELLADRAFT_103261 [Melampsora larici-populina 98AG31]EGG10581.1 hypothetical protein MELLADRAFT_103261 [Melampsora larici-populina 98AG31]